MEYSRQKKDEENKWRYDICPDGGTEWEGTAACTSIPGLVLKITQKTNLLAELCGVVKKGLI